MNHFFNTKMQHPFTHKSKSIVFLTQRTKDAKSQGYKENKKTSQLQIFSLSFGLCSFASLLLCVKNNIFLKVIICFLLVGLSGCCGYSWGQGGILSSPQTTISIPYIKGDNDGSFTAILIQRIAQSGGVTYQQCGGTLTLFVEIVCIEDEDISFRYDRKKSGHLRKSIIPDETRLSISADVWVLNASGELILGPARLTANVAFDHDYYSSRGGVNVFSLGQLTDVDEARDAAMRPLQARLAEKIVDFLYASF